MPSASTSFASNSNVTLNTTTGSGSTTSSKTLPSRLSIRIGETIEVEVGPAGAVSPHQLWLRLYNNTADALMNRIDQNELEIIPANELRLFQYVLCRHQDPSSPALKFRRARVLQFDGNLVKLQYVDHGTRVWQSRTQMFVLPELLKYHPWQSFSCALSHVHCRHQQHVDPPKWPVHVCGRLQRLLADVKHDARCSNLRLTVHRKLPEATAGKDYYSGELKFDVRLHTTGKTLTRDVGRMLAMYEPRDVCYDSNINPVIALSVTQPREPIINIRQDQSDNQQIIDGLLAGPSTSSMFVDFPNKLTCFQTESEETWRTRHFLNHDSSVTLRVKRTITCEDPIVPSPHCFFVALVPREQLGRGADEINSVNWQRKINNHYKRAVGTNRTWGLNTDQLWRLLRGESFYAIHQLSIGHLPFDTNVSCDIGADVIGYQRVCVHSAYVLTPAGTKQAVQLDPDTQQLRGPAGSIHCLIRYIDCGGLARVPWVQLLQIEKKHLDQPPGCWPAALAFTNAKSKSSNQASFGFNQQQRQQSASQNQFSREQSRLFADIVDCDQEYTATLGCPPSGAGGSFLFSASSEPNIINLGERHMLYLLDLTPKHEALIFDDMASSSAALSSSLRTQLQSVNVISAEDNSEW